LGVQIYKIFYFSISKKYFMYVYSRIASNPQLYGP